MRFLAVSIGICTICMLIPNYTKAQDRVKVSGMAYLDYYYMINSPDSEEEGDNGFSYRRLYLTTDFAISENFQARARLEARGSSTVPFVKDLYLQWRDTFGEGHHITFGVASPPSFTVAEKVWGYRSLDKTILDRVNVVSSRDFGIKLNGPITSSGSLKYSFMVANNDGVSDDTNTSKRIYSQLEIYPSENVSATIGADYSAEADQDIANLNGFLGYTANLFSAGVEGFVSQIDDADEVENATFYGISTFGEVGLNEKWSVVGRFDHVDREFDGVSRSAAYALVALVFSPEKNIKIMPNIIYGKSEGAPTNSLTGRLTIEANL